MKYTEKYHLPQWEETDRIMRTDFNRMCADIESGLNTNAQAAAKAHSAADRAQATAEYRPYVIGSYVGTGVRNRHIFLGFQPKFIIVAAMQERPSGSSSIEAYSAITCGNNLPKHLKITEDGFTVSCNPEANLPDLNREGFTYDYLIFR